MSSSSSPSSCLLIKKRRPLAVLFAPVNSLRSYVPPPSSSPLGFASSQSSFESETRVKFFFSNESPEFGDASEISGSKSSSKY